MKIFFQEIFADSQNTETITKNIKALARLSDARGKDIGTVSFEQIGQEVLVKVNIHDMPEGIHGFHIHERGLCETPDFASGGGHYNPFHKQHGLKNPEGPHAGDLPNISIDSDGNCVTEFFTEFISLDPAALNSVFKEGGTAVIIHERPDDYISDPTGMASSRLACGVIEKI
ncbi:MAG: superoxide dismutase family protein [Candidatus Ratteibacteria bacterium]|nr:superoxide dismutase family protein [Candidatus Ratteibacteria bacterium]